MNAFNVIQSQFCLLGICSPPKNQPHTLAFHRKYLAILFLITLQIVLEIVFLAIEAANYDEISASVFIILTSFVSIVFYLSLKCQSNSVFKLISHFDAFVHDRSKMPDLGGAYEKNDRKINELIQRMHFGMVNLSLNFGFASSAVLCTFNYIRSDFDDTALALPAVMWLPFGIHNVFAYYAAVLLQYGIWYFVVMIFFCSIGFLITLCKMVSMFLRDLTVEWRHLDSINETGVQRKLTMAFHDLIGVHSQIIQFALRMTHMCQHIITALYLWSIILICFSLLGTLFTVTNISTTTGTPLIGDLIGLFWVLALMFILCQFGQHLTDQFATFERTIYECQWYTYPSDVQLQLLTVMNASQKPIEFEAYGDVCCTFATFKNIVNGSFSYFTMLLKIMR